VHIPDGFIDAKTALTTAAVAATGLALATREVRRTLSPSRVPLLGLLAAFIFAAQMLNFPVAGGTSGHLIGAVLAAVILGPSAAVLVMSAVLILQCLMFSDGGVTALGANILNMALAAPIIGYTAYRIISRLLGDTLRARLTGAAFGSWCSTVAASIACAVELAASGTARWNVIFTAMAGVHAIIGLGEALITALVLSTVVKLRPELLQESSKLSAAPSQSRRLVYGIVVAFALMLLLAPLASPWPDGLERVAESLGFAHVATDAVLPSPLPDYELPGVNSPILATILAGLLGTLVVFAISCLLARGLTSERKPQTPLT